MEKKISIIKIDTDKKHKIASKLSQALMLQKQHGRKVRTNREEAGEKFQGYESCTMKDDLLDKQVIQLESLYNATAHQQTKPKWTFNPDWKHSSIQIHLNTNNHASIGNEIMSKG